MRVLVTVILEGPQTTAHQVYLLNMHEDTCLDYFEGVEGGERHCNSAAGWCSCHTLPGGRRGSQTTALQSSHSANLHLTDLVLRTL